MNDKLQGLNLLTEFVREQYSAIGVSLDYSLESLKILDKLFDDEYKNGELINQAGSIAGNQEMILTGVAGYLANVMI
ncbi:MAG TPA: hypothetical protein VKI61_19785 [Chitinophagaceae bacterium]|jgi:hypothetical protein|nr:hypothetical protein [Chitinophagaceae bacterium]